MTTYKHPESVLVLITDTAGQALLLERARHPGCWQSVTGSLEPGESPLQAAQRELGEETGIHLALSAFTAWPHTNRYRIADRWRHRYAPHVTHNLEYVFSVTVTERCPVTLAPDEHRDYRWLPVLSAAAACFSWSNRDGLRLLAQDISMSRCIQ